jgi:hypothetical protein
MRDHGVSCWLDAPFASWPRVAQARSRAAWPGRRALARARSSSGGAPRTRSPTSHRRVAAAPDDVRVRVELARSSFWR